VSSHRGGGTPHDERPSLLMDDRDWQHGPSAEPIRMLSALESQTRPRGRTARPASVAPDAGAGGWMRALMAVLVLAVLGTAGAYVWLLTHADRPPLAAAPEAVTEPAQALARPTATPPTVRPASAPRVTAATIESLPVAAAPPSASARATPSPFDELQRPEVADPGPGSSAPAAVPRPTSQPTRTAASPVATKAAAATPAASTMSLRLSTALAAAPDPTAPPQEPPGAGVGRPPEPPPATRTPAERRQAQREADAALLSALVSHVRKHSRQEVNGEMPPLRLPGSGSGSVTTIAQIVNQCRSLHGEEAKVCRVRICENYWGKDDACSIRPTFLAHEPH